MSTIKGDCPCCEAARERQDKPPKIRADRKILAGRFVITNLWADGHRTYENGLRDPDDDRRLSLSDHVDDAIHHLGLGDGDEIEIIVKTTGRRPFGKRRVVLTEPHTYEREPESDTTKGDR